MRRSQPGSRLRACSLEKTGGSADLRAIPINLTSPRIELPCGGIRSDDQVEQRWTASQASFDTSWCGIMPRVS